MTEKTFTRNSLYATALVTLAIGAHLAWDHTHGGVPSHHLLADENLPAISNWWGALLLPALTWFLLYRIRKSAFSTKPGVAGKANALRHQLYGIAGGLVFGIVLSLFFSFGYQTICSYMLMGLFGASLFIPVYSAGCLLGFVIGMTFTFGAILPLLIGSILCIINFIIYRLIRPALLYIATKLGLMLSLTKRKPTL